jgi:hypothetical protein
MAFSLCPRATWQASTGRAPMHQASGQAFDDRAARQAIDQER